MSYFPRFVFPTYLLLLVLVPWAVYLGLHLRALDRRRRIVATALRAAILTAMVLALAGAEIVRVNDRLSVFFLLDQSDSIPDAVRQQAAQWVRNAVDTHMTTSDAMGVIAFGGDASIELKVGPQENLRSVASYVAPENTDIAGAIRLAQAAFPQGAMRRVVILTDGNETRGDALEEVKAARGNGVGVDIVPLTIARGPEVRVREVSAPGQANAQEPFQLRVVVTSNTETNATLRLYQDVGGERRMLVPQQVRLQPGDNVYLLTQEITDTGLYEYEVSIEADDDSLAANNTGRAFTLVQGEPTVLLVQSESGAGEYLEQALLAEGVQVASTVPLRLPGALAQYQAYDTIILDDISATQLSADQMAMFETLVRDQGIGLVMVGGPNAYGAGGYLGTPIERALPVDMDIKQRQVLPRGALAVVMHTCEIPDGNVWARDIALAALNTLSAQDLMAVLGYLWDKGDSFIQPLAPVNDKQLHAETIRRASQQIGDMPDVGPTLNMAYKALSSADAAVKRVIIISDGDPAAPTRALVDGLAAAKIPVSTICINPHSMNDQDMLRALADETGGRYYYVTDPRNLPQIFSKEAATVKRGLLVEKPFTPAPLHDSELLFGLAENALPQLRGYVVTTPKDTATVPLVAPEDDPVLAHWRYGLGKAVAFTSDTTSRWATDWLSWPGFNRFWAQTVRWSMREATPSSFQVQTRIADGRGHIRIDAVTDDGEFVNFLRPQGVVTGPGPAFETLPVELSQTAPGVYEGSFPVDKAGTYLANIAYAGENDTTGRLSTGVSLDYSREYEYLETNRARLERIASAGGGRILEAGENPFRHDLKATGEVTPLWMYLVIFAAAALPVEIFVRRVMLPWDTMGAAVLAALRKLPGLSRMLPQPRPRQRPATGVYRGAVAQEHRFGEPGTAAPASQQESRAGAATPAAETTPAARPQSEYTAQLLAAKERAKKATKQKFTKRDGE